MAYKLIKIELEPSIGASGGFTWPEERGKEMAKNSSTASFKLVVKNGDSKYVIEKSGQYTAKTIDYVQEFDTFAAALEVFAGYVTDDYNEDKVTLTLIPAKKK